MDELLLKSFELGALGLFSALLLTRGLNAVKDLADSNRQLADAVAKLSDKVNSIDDQVKDFKFSQRDILLRLNKIEQTLEKLTN